MIRRIPLASRVTSFCPHTVCHGEILRPRLHPVEERSPDLSDLRTVESLARHTELKSVVRLKVDVLAPMRIKELVAIEADEALDQLPERRIGVRRDLAASTAEIFWKLVRA